MIESYADKVDASLRRLKKREMRLGNYPQLAPSIARISARKYIDVLLVELPLLYWRHILRGNVLGEDNA